jgi:hypothetical protein
MNQIAVNATEGPYLRGKVIATQWGGNDRPGDNARPAGKPGSVCRRSIVSTHNGTLSP